MEDVLLSCFVVSNVTVMMLLLIPIEKAVIWSHGNSKSAPLACWTFQSRSCSEDESSKARFV